MTEEDELREELTRVSRESTEDAEYLAILNPKYKEVFSQPKSFTTTHVVKNKSKLGVDTYVGLNGDCLHVIFKEDATEISIYKLTKV